jgi:hypothetical protein
MALGRMATVAPSIGGQGGILLRYEQVASTCGDTCRMPSEEAGVMTLNVQVRLRAPLSENEDISDAYLRVVYGSENETHTIEADLDCQIRIPCMTFTAYVVYPVVPRVNQPIIDVMATVGRWSAGQLPATRTIKVGNLIAQTPSLSLPVPAFASEALLATQDTTNTVEMSLYAGMSGVAMQTGDLSKYAHQGLIIPNGARFFDLTPGGESGVDGASVVFKLHL